MHRGDERRHSSRSHEASRDGTTEAAPRSTSARGRAASQEAPLLDTPSRGDSATPGTVARTPSLGSPAERPSFPAPAAPPQGTASAQVPLHRGVSVGDTQDAAKAASTIEPGQIQATPASADALARSIGVRTVPGDPPAQGLLDGAAPRVTAPCAPQATDTGGRQSDPAAHAEVSPREPVPECAHAAIPAAAAAVRAPGLVPPMQHPNPAEPRRGRPDRAVQPRQASPGATPPGAVDTAERAVRSTAHTAHTAQQSGGVPCPPAAAAREHAAPANKVSRTLTREPATSVEAAAAGVSAQSPRAAAQREEAGSRGGAHSAAHSAAAASLDSDIKAELDAELDAMSAGEWSPAQTPGPAPPKTPAAAAGSTGASRRGVPAFSRWVRPDAVRLRASAVLGRVPLMLLV